MLANISISFATGKPYQPDLLLRAVTALIPLGFQLTGKYHHHQFPAEPFPCERYEEGDFEIITKDMPDAATDMEKLQMITSRVPVTYLGLSWSTEIGQVSGILSVRIFEDDTSGIDLTLPEATDQGKIAGETWQETATALYYALQPLYGAVLVEDEVPGPTEVGPESELTLIASWIYLGPRLAEIALHQELDSCKPLHEEKRLDDGGLFLASSPEPAMAHTDKEKRLYDMVNELIRSKT